MLLFLQSMANSDLVCIVSKQTHDLDRNDE